MRPTGAGVPGLLSLLMLTSGAGCHREGPIERSAREYRSRHKDQLERGSLETARTQMLSDDQLVRMNPKDGIGIGLRVEKTELRVNEPLKLHLVYENFGAETPISATTCQGFSLGSEDEETLVSTAVAIRLSCAEGDFNRDNNVPLPPGELRRASVSTEGTKLLFDHPGTYVLVAGWQVFRTREGMFLRPDGYSVVASNRVLITVR